MFRINTLGHLLTYKHLVPLVPNRKQLAKAAAEWKEDPAKKLLGDDKSLCFSLSARVGSIGDNDKGGWYSYRSYVWLRTMANRPSIVFVALTPGQKRL